MVGAVILDEDGHVAGEGFHREAGQPHAEQEALAAAASRARGGTLYVNLEPCSHEHRTPPCAEAVVKAGVRRVVISMEDPDVRVRGAGIRILEGAGIEVVVGPLAKEARNLNEFYVKHRTTGRPFVSAKFAMSLDGKIATHTGESHWITGIEARAHGHRLRHSHDAILVGVNTVIADDPQLTARLDGAQARQPLRVVVDSKLRTPVSAKVVGANTLIASTESRPIGDAEVLRMPATDEGRVALPALLDELGKRGILSLLVEGGGEVHAAFLDEGLVDKVFAYIAPRLIGGREAPGAVGGLGVERPKDAIPLRNAEVIRLGDDFLIAAYVDVHRDS
jgi:diaminohydroxyphosphoribosylaminopyrimidine deaminase/5-amino-6-(5-phosphoribosylamino)uracil reductase